MPERGDLGIELQVLVELVVGPSWDVVGPVLLAVGVVGAMPLEEHVPSVINGFVAGPECGILDQLVAVAYGVDNGAVEEEVYVVAAVAEVEASLGVNAVGADVIDRDIVPVDVVAVPATFAGDCHGLSGIHDDGFVERYVSLSAAEVRVVRNDVVFQVHGSVPVVVD